MIKTIELLKNRRTHYDLDDKIKVSDEKIQELVEEITELVPDAFNMKSQRVVLAQNDEHKKLWDAIYEEFNGEVAREKIDSFKNASGTILFFYDNKIVKTMKENFPLYEKQFEKWAYQANGMLQISIWNALEELDLGASLQHYNPIIDKRVKEMFALDDDYVLLGQLVYGKKLSTTEEKEKEDISNRVKIFK